MLMTVRSVRLIIGRIPAPAAASISTLAGKQKTYSTPSRRSTSAIAALPFTSHPPAAARRPACALLHPDSRPDYSRDRSRLVHTPEREVDCVRRPRLVGTTRGEGGRSLADGRGVSDVVAGGEGRRAK